MIDPEELARRAAEAAEAEDMAGGQEPSDADRALADGGAATDEVDVAEAVAAADVEPPPAAGEPGVPAVLSEGGGDGGSAGEGGQAGGSGPQDELSESAASAEHAATEPPTVEHPLPATPAPADSSAADGPPSSAGTAVPEAAPTAQPAAIPAPTAARAAEPAEPADIHVHAPGFAIADTPLPGTQPLADAENFIERAIESVLEQVPDVAGEEPEGSAKLQPWAETAAPPSKNKRPLSELLEQYAARVAAAPDAVAGRPRGQHPIAAFFARFTPQGGGRGAAEGAGTAGGGRGRRRRGRRGVPQTGGQAPAPQQGEPRPQGGRPPRGPRPPGDQRPQRDQRQVRPATAGPTAGGPPGNAPQDAQRRSRRRGRRRGRSGGGGGGGGGAPAQG